MARTTNRNDIKSLKRLISALRPTELIILKDQLHPKKTGSTPKTLQLLEYVLANKEAVHVQTHLKISPASSASAFSMLIGELKKKIYDSLTVDVNIDRKGVYPDRYKIDFHSKKYLMAAKILHRRGLHQDERVLIDKIIADTKKYEVFDTLIDALLMKVHLEAILGNEIDCILKEIAYFQSCRQLYEDTKLLYAEITNRAGFERHTGDISYLEDKYTNIRNRMTDFPSDTVWFWLNECSVYFLLEKKKYLEADEVLNKILYKLQSSKVIRMAKRICGTHIQLAENCIFLGRLDGCYYNAQQALQLLEKGSHNYYLAQEFSFKAKFHQRQYGKANLILRTLLAGDYRKVSPFIYARWKVYKAATMLLRGKHEIAANFIAQTTALDTDKEGWNMAIRVLEIMIQIDSGKHNHLGDEKITNLIAFTRSLKNKLSKRNALITSVLRSLKMSGYNFREVSKICKSQLQLLCSSDEAFHWSMAGPELIRFDAWFMAKTKNVEYCYDFALNP